MGNHFFDFFEYWLKLLKKIRIKIWCFSFQICFWNQFSTLESGWAESIFDFGKWSNGKSANTRSDGVYINRVTSIEWHQQCDIHRCTVWPWILLPPDSVSYKFIPFACRQWVPTSMIRTGCTTMTAALSKTEHSILHDYPHTSNNSLSPKKVLKKERKKLDKSEVLIDINL